MRLGVIDIGSNTVHLLVVDAHPGAQPLPAFSHKTELRLSESLRADGRVSDETADRLVAFIRECLGVAEDQGVGDLFAFATSRHSRMKATSRSAVASLTRPSASRLSERRSSVLCEKAGSGCAPGCASTTRRWTVLDPMSMTPRRMPQP